MSGTSQISFTQRLRQEFGLIANNKPVYKKTINLDDDPKISENEILDNDSDGKVSDQELNSFFWSNLRFMKKGLVQRGLKGNALPFLRQFGFALLAINHPSKTFAFKAAYDLFDSLKPVDPYAPLEIQTNEGSFFLYSGNGFYRQFKAACAGYISRDSVITGSELDRCLQDLGNPPLEKNGLLKYFRILRERTAYIEMSDKAEIEEIYEALRTSPGIELKATSTAAGVDMHELKKEYMRQHQDEGGRPNFPEYYRKIYGAPLLPYPKHLNLDELQVEPNYRTSDQLPPDGTLPLLRTVTNGRAFYHFFDTPYGGITIHLPERTHHVISLVTHFKDDIENAAKILFQHHPQIHLNNFRLLLYTRMSEELQALDWEDPWQDMSACVYSGCSLKEAFQRELDGAKIGPRVGGVNFNLPWELSSALTMEMEKQGFGPAQANLGLVREAAEEKKILDHYKGFLRVSDFSNNKAALRTILENPVYSWALSYDYVLTKLEETVFQNPVVRLSKRSRPYFQNAEGAREYALLSSAAYLTAYPEKDVAAKENVLIGTKGYSAKYICADFYQIEPYFSGIKLLKVRQPSVDRRTLVFYVVVGAE